ncbi:hypothetical protein HYDPIDRAFT_112331 [Hydnomerulius pinastri MD-312]|uniref:Meiotically up-regulated protein Msb1/Mug8 domain-containing protein n=1 Tax=Hydnomerulius pinastri MD-312 TaxID=994086 RepID=A0A0C9WFN7_9AGAM|nr:hypothetical protein HYDPIDRAFT_112331 [Hydnomerulius pinastri MD-312]
MPSFLNKVFGRKKQDDKDAPRSPNEASDNALLEGKYEAISPVLSPSAIAFADGQGSKDKEREVGFSLFRPKSRVGSPKSSQKRADAVPQLSLHLPGPKQNSDSRALGVVFEADPESQTVLDDAVIGAKRLNPLETLILVRACAQAITERGLETLGIMHPHWFSASPDIQRKLISLFIHSLAPKSRITTLSPTPTSPTSAFENELSYTRSPHDVAAVLRWGLRHLKLENGHFGKDVTAAEWAWYKSFFDAERDASYPPKGFTDLLPPQLPTAHIELLTATLDVISGLAAHAEANSISGSKLSKFLGLWLLTAIRSEDTDDWTTFYARWERAGRILEHLFLSRLREESLDQRLPTRLQELVKYYPYNKGSPATEEDLLPPPRFTTRKYDALFVRVESVLLETAEQPKQHPVRLILEAFQLQTGAQSGDEHWELWNGLKTAATEASSEASPSSSSGPQLTHVFVDETIQLLSMIPADSSDPSSPTLLASPIANVVSRRRSPSFSRILERKGSKTNGDNGSAAVSPTTLSSAIITDWAQFSTSGFGDVPVAQPLAATLFDQEDVEVTQPPVSRKSSRKRGTSRTRRRSPDNGPSATPATSQLSVADSPIIETKLASVHLIQIDEAFIDFWSDAIVDPLSASWPTFVICGLKPIPGAEKPVQWLVVEQAYSRQRSQPSPRPASPDGPRGRTSPRPSFRSDISGFRIGSTLAATRKRFSIFGKSTNESAPKKSAGRSPKVGELGEILAEEEEKPEEKPKSNHASPVTNGGSRVETVAGTSAAAAILATGAVVAATATETQTEAHAVPIPEEVMTGPVPEPQPTASAGLISASTSAPAAVSKEATVPVSDQPAGSQTDASKGQTQYLAEEVPSVESVAQPGNESIEAPLAPALVPVSEEKVPSELIIDEVEAQPGNGTVSSFTDAVPEPQETAGDEDALPPAPEAVVLAGETPGPQVALNTSEPAALAHITEETQAVQPEVVASADEPAAAPLVVADEVAPEAAPADAPVTEEAAEADLPEVPIVDASPELPVTPVEQVPLVQEPVVEQASESVPVIEEPAAPTAPTDNAGEEAPTEPAVEEAQAAVASVDVVEEPVAEPVEESTPSPVVEEAQAPPPADTDVVEVQAEEPVHESAVEAVEESTPEHAVEEAQPVVPVSVDVVEEPATVEEPVAEPVQESLPAPADEESPAPATLGVDAEEEVTNSVQPEEPVSQPAEGSSFTEPIVSEEDVPVGAAPVEPVELVEEPTVEEALAEPVEEPVEESKEPSVPSDAPIADVDQPGVEDTVDEAGGAATVAEPVEEGSEEVAAPQDAPVEELAREPEVDVSTEPAEEVKPEEIQGTPTDGESDSAIDENGDVETTETTSQ